MMRQKRGMKESNKEGKWRKKEGSRREQGRGREEGERIERKGSRRRRGRREEKKNGEGSIRARDGKRWNSNEGHA